MLPEIPEPMMIVVTEDGSEAVVRCACRKLFGGVCQNECVEEGLGRPGSEIGSSVIMFGAVVSAMVRRGSRRLVR